MESIQYKYRDMMTRRKKLHDCLNLDCIFPSSMKEDNNCSVEEVCSTTWRCLLDLKNCDQGKGGRMEDIVCRMLENCSEKDCSGFKVILSKLFNRLPVTKNVSLNLYAAMKPTPTALHPGLCCIYNYIEHSSNVFLIQEYIKHSCLSLSRCHTATSLSSPTFGRSTGDGAKDLRLRFLFYQLLQVVSFVHSVGLCLYPLTPQKILLADDIWLTVLVSLSRRVQDCVNDESAGDISEDGCLSPSHSKEPLYATEAARDSKIHTQQQCQTIPCVVGHRESITSQWASRKISNFEYIMLLNAGAGRSLIDPLYHPIMPWLTDFSVDLFSERDGFSHNIIHHRNQPYLRDLTRSMFRLSKGDAQLETTFAHSDPPHHIPESLSELTYYIYMARVTPMHVLRRVVRNDFVPEHYPHSMTRMYAWSPDECIPEFFTDTSAFKSIHSDVGLHDIQLPSFAPTPEAFLSYHMKLLESDYVSAQLHHWIDLSFGICLSGQEAIDNMNIPLQHTTSARERMGDAPNIDKHPGFVQLFLQSHPPRHMFDHQHPGHKAGSVAASSAAQPHAVPAAAGGVSCLSDDSEEDEGIDVVERRVELNTTVHNLLAIEPRMQKRGKRSRNIVATMSDKAKSVFFGDSVHDGRKYLDADISDSSLMLLRNVPHITLKDDDEICSKNDTVMKSIVKEQTFSSEYDPYLDAKYALESNLLDADPISMCCEPDCAETPADSSSSVGASSRDAHFYSSLENLKDTSTGWSSGVEESSAGRVRSYQADDMFSVGCILAEMYSGKPLLSESQTAKMSRCRQVNDAVEYNKLLRIVVDALSRSIPLIVRRLVASLLHFNPKLRPTAAEVLAATTAPNYDDWSSGTFNGPCKDGVVHFLKKKGKGTTDQDHTDDADADVAGRADIINFLFTFSPSVFPPYFTEAYSSIGRIKLCQKSEEPLKVLAASITQLQVMPIEGIGFLIPHITSILKSAGPFRECYDGQMELSFYESGKEAPLIQHYIAVVDVVGSRLGVEATEKIIIPAVHSFFSTLNSACVLRLFLYSSLWQVIIHRGGVKCFLRQFLPFLLTSLLSGTMQSITNRILCLGEADFGHTCPLWATLGNVMPEDWLHASSPDETQLVQQAAKVTISRLAYAENMGAGLTTRYILPALLCLVGIPQLSFAKNSEAYVSSRAARAVLFRDILHEDQLDEAIFYRSSRTAMVTRETDLEGTAPAVQMAAMLMSNADAQPEVTDYSVLPRPLSITETHMSEEEREKCIKNIIQDCTSFDNQGLYLTRTIQSICTTVGELVTAEVVLAKIFGSILPHIRIADTNPTPSPSTLSAYKEVISLLTGLLAGLSQETIVEYYLVPAKPGRSSIPQLLVDLPLLMPKQLITFNHHTDSVSSDEQLRATIELYRYHLVLLDLCKLLVSCCMSVGGSVTIDVVLPHVNKFYGSFVATYQNIPVESIILHKAFKVGAELFVPLAQLVGDETFHTHVPHMNPRLELWLSSTYAGGPCYSPPLPSGIFPDTVYSNNDTHEHKRKGFFSWMYKEKNAAAMAATAKLSAATNDTPVPPNGAMQAAQIVAQNQDQLLNISATNNFSRKMFISENRVMSVDSAIVLQEYAIQMDRSSTLLQHTRKLTSEGLAMGHIDRSKNGTVSSQDGTDIQTHEPFQPAGAGYATPSKYAVDSDYPSEEDDQTAHAVMTLDSDHGPVPAGHPSLANSRTRGFSHTTDESNDCSKEGGGASLSSLRSVSTTSASDFTIRHSDAVVEDRAMEEQYDETVDAFSRPVDREDIVDDPPLASVIVPSDSVEFLFVEDDVDPHPSNAPLLSSLLNASPSRPLQGATPLDKGHQKTKDSVAVDRRVKNFGINEEEDVDMEHSFYDDCTWLLSGNGRWNAQAEELKAAGLLEKHERQDKERQDKADETEAAATIAPVPRPTRNSMSFAASIRSRDKHPAAQVSMTSPRIAVDVAVEAGCLFALEMQNNTQFQVEESINPDKHNSLNNAVKCMAVNSSESLLATSSRSGVKLWSLSSQPIKQVGSYSSHANAPHYMNFLRNGSQMATCNGSINIADVETQKSVAFLKGWSSGPDEKGGYSFMSAVSPRHGISPGLACHGDDQLMACSGMDMTFLDFRADSAKPLRPVAEWKLPQILSTGTSLAFTGRSAVNTTTNGVRDVPHLTSAASNEDYVYSASSTGGLWVIDRRTGKVLQTCQGHSSSVLKVVSLSPHQFLSVCEKSACLWDCRHSEIKKLATISHIIDSSAGLTANTVLVHNFEFSANALSGHHFHDSGNGSGSGQGNSTTKPISVMYCLSGHKLCVGKIPNYNSAGIAESKMTYNYAATNTPKEGVNDGDEVKLDLAYFADRKNNKLTKQKLQVSSATLLPLRRLLLVGTEDGQVRVVT